MALTWVSGALLAGPESPTSEADQFTAGNTNILQQGRTFDLVLLHQYIFKAVIINSKS